MLPPMNNTVKYTLREAAGIAGNVARAYALPLALPVVLPVAVAGIAALSAAALGSWLADSGQAILSELRVYSYYKDGNYDNRRNRYFGKMYNTQAHSMQFPAKYKKGEFKNNNY